MTFRELYDIVRGKDAAGGQGANGFHGNVRTHIKRIREKFLQIDDATARFFGFDLKETGGRRAGRRR